MTTIFRDNLGLYENKLPQNLLVETHFRCDMFTDTNIGLIIVIRMICVPQKNDFICEYLFIILKIHLSTTPRFAMEGNVCGKPKLLAAIKQQYTV